LFKKDQNQHYQLYEKECFFHNPFYECIDDIFNEWNFITSKTSQYLLVNCSYAINLLSYLILFLKLIHKNNQFWYENNLKQVIWCVISNTMFVHLNCLSAVDKKIHIRYITKKIHLLPFFYCNNNQMKRKILPTGESW
jgi:hypothetical protein